MIYLPNAASQPSPNAETQSLGSGESFRPKRVNLRVDALSAKISPFPFWREAWVLGKQKNRFSSILRGHFFGATGAQASYLKLIRKGLFPYLSSIILDFDSPSRLHL
jgi:hypothetical protein